MRGTRGTRRAIAAGSSGWLLTLSDCMLLLLTFFVMLFAMSSVRNERWRDFSHSLASTLRPLTVIDPRALPRPAAEPMPLAGKRDVDYLAGLLSGMLDREPALAGYGLARGEDGLAIRPTSILWQEAAGNAAAAPAIGKLGRAALALLVDRLRLVDNTVVVRVRASSDAGAWNRAMARGLALADALAEAGLGREAPVLATFAGGGEDEGVALLVRPPREGSL